MTDEVKGVEDANNTQTDQTPEIADDLPKVDELQLLKQRAKAMGINFSGNIGLDALKAKINAKMNDEPQPEEDEKSNGDDSSEPDAQKVEAPKAERKLTLQEQKAQVRLQMKKEEMALVRLRITNLNPQKKDLPGEIFTVANEYIGTVRKFIPYGELTDDGFHVPMIIYRQLKDRKFLHIRTVKDKRTGTPRVVTSWQREFALEELPQLTKEQLRDLAIAQAAAGSVPSADEEAL